MSNCPECGKPMVPCRELHLLDFRDYQLVMYPDGLCTVVGASRASPLWCCRTCAVEVRVSSGDEAEWSRALVKAVASQGTCITPDSVPQAGPVADWRPDVFGAERLETHGLILHVIHAYGERWSWGVYRAATRKACGVMDGPDAKDHCKKKALAAVPGVLERLEKEKL